jgi:hypothetical protein
MLRKAVESFRELGVVDGACYAIDSLLAKVTSGCRLYCHYVVVQPVPAVAALPARLLEKLQINDLVQESEALGAMPIPPGVVRARFTQGAKCVGIFRDSEFIGYAWLSFGQYSDDEIRIDYLMPDSRAAFDFDVYIFEKYRIGRSFAYVWDGINQKLRECGIRWTCSRISRFNLPSIRSHMRLKARIVDRITVLKLGRLELFLNPRIWKTRMTVRDSCRVKYLIRASETAD